VAMYGSDRHRIATSALYREHAEWHGIPDETYRRRHTAGDRPSHDHELSEDVGNEHVDTNSLAPR